MASVSSQLIEEVTAHAQCDSLEDAREICVDGTYFLNNLLIFYSVKFVYIVLFLNLAPAGVFCRLVLLIVYIFC